MTKDPTPFHARYISRPFDPNRKRFYFAVSDLQKIGDYKLRNESLLNEYGIEVNAYPKPEFYRIPAGKNIFGNDVHYSFQLGLAPDREVPKIKVALKKKPIDVYGSNTGCEPIFVSSRAKALFELIDPDAFAFLPCETSTRRTIEIEPYWVCNVKRLVSEFDEEKSIFINDGPDDRKLSTGKFTTLSSDKAFDIHMKAEMPNTYQAFLLMQFGSYPIFSEAIVDAWRAAKMTGLKFTPLQTPTKKEERSAASFLTWMYYFQSGREFWEGKI